MELVKKPGNYKVADMRTIVLYEADFNQNNKLLGRSTMFNAESLGLLADEQYGSRKSHSAIEHGVNKCLTFDLLQQKWHPGSLCSNNAKSCYDCIVHLVASISMQCIGAPLMPIVSMFSTIQHMQHHVRTAYGDSSSTFGGQPNDTPVHGVGQGNGAGLAIWAVVSSPIIAMMQANGYGTCFSSALSGEEVRFMGYAFVDDTDLCQTAQKLGETGSDVAAQLQAAVNCWEGRIRATGGAIVLEKSHWYLVDFGWRDGQWFYLPMNLSPASLMVKDTTGVRRLVEQLEVSEAQRTLGV